MTDPLNPPPKKNPQKRTVSPTLPPELRSRASLGLSAAAAEGRFMLQRCAACDTWQYPPRDACSACMSSALPWCDVPPEGTLLAETTVRTSTNVYFRERAPWRTGTVQLDAGPVIICHVHGDCTAQGRVRMDNRLDRSGQGVLIAMPLSTTPNMEDDEQLREMISNPKHRRVLITDARAPSAAALANALLDAGASVVFVGESERWRSYPAQALLDKIPGVEQVPLDVTDTQSVKLLAGEIGGKTDILINNARFVRPGGVMDRGDTAFARNEIDVNYLGLMRLAQAFGPAMSARAADGVNSAVAWVNILTVHALSNSPAFGSFSASSAAAHSLSQCLRAEFRSSGIRVTNVFTGPTDDDWFQPLPPPKVTADALARSVVSALQRGLEDVYCGDVARDLVERLRAGAKVLERELTMSGSEP